MSHLRFRARQVRVKLPVLRRRLRALESMVVALSGGVDSSVLLAVAARELPGRVLAATGSAHIVPPSELTSAAQVARHLGVPHRHVSFTPLQDPRFTANTAQRCYHCKRRLMGQLMALARESGYAVVTEGSNADDLQQLRPGMQAVRELGVLSPLQEAGFTKGEIRLLARCLRLPVWNRPAQSCLATRIEPGCPITLRRLRMARDAEAAIHAQGIPVVRVRSNGTDARIQVPPAYVARLALAPFRDSLVKMLKRMGYCRITLDLEGYRPSSGPAN